MSVHTDFSYLRNRAGSSTDIERLNQIEKDRNSLLKNAALFQYDDFIEKASEEYTIQLDGMTFCFSRKRAPSSVDTYIEIFRDHAHCLIDGFGAEDKQTVIDIGANEGFYTLKMKRDNPSLSVISVEPVSENYRMLKRNLELNKVSGVECLQAAILDRKGTIPFETYPHVSTVASTDILRQGRPWINPDKIEIKNVNALTLSHLFNMYNVRHADILKIDVEGSEYQLLEAGRKTLSSVSHIVLEWHTHKIREKCRTLLEEEGFSLVYEEFRHFGDMYFKRTTPKIMESLHSESLYR